MALTTVYALTCSVILITACSLHIKFEIQAISYIVDPKHLFALKNQIFSFFGKYTKLRKNRWASNSHHMLFACKVWNLMSFVAPEKSCWWKSSPCSDSRHVTAPYKLTYYYYYDHHHHHPVSQPISPSWHIRASAVLRNMRYNSVDNAKINKYSNTNGSIWTYRPSSSRVGFNHLMSHQTHYRSYRNDFYGSDDPTNSVTPWRTTVGQSTR